MEAASTTAGTVSLEEFEAFADDLRGRGRCELIRGEIRTMAPASGPHGSITNRIAYLLTGHVFAAKLGEVFTAETGFRLPDPDDAESELSVRAPDVSFIPKDRAGIARQRGFIRTHPDLAVEVHSPDDRVGEIAEKTSWWLTRGVAEVWNVDPAAETIAVHLSNGSIRLFQRGQAAASPQALPGFKVDLNDLFDV